MEPWRLSIHEHWPNEDQWIRIVDYASLMIALLNQNLKRQHLKVHLLIWKWILQCLQHGPFLQTAFHQNRADITGCDGSAKTEVLLKTRTLNAIELAVSFFSFKPGRNRTKKGDFLSKRAEISSVFILQRQLSKPLLSFMISLNGGESRRDISFFTSILNEKTLSLDDICFHFQSENKNKCRERNSKQTIRKLRFPLSVIKAEINESMLWKLGIFDLTAWRRRNYCHECRTCNPTYPFAILEPRNPSIEELNVLWKHQSTGIEALNLRERVFGGPWSIFLQFLMP